MKTPAMVLLTGLFLGLSTYACGEGCTVGETWCDGDVIMECMEDYSEDGDFEDDDDGECGFLCSLIEMFVDANDDDTYEVVVTDCSDHNNKTCFEETDATGETDAYCDYAANEDDW